jgi:hypothetical protein
MIQNIPLNVEWQAKTKRWKIQNIPLKVIKVAMWRVEVTRLNSNIRKYIYVLLSWDIKI